jgi:hypothetical protein
VRKDNDNVLYGYSALTGTATELQTTETPFTSGAIDFVGFAHESYSYTKYHAFNGFYGNWVELVPTGSFVGGKCGGKTIVILHSNTIYAFDPEAGGTFVGDDVLGIPYSVSLSQNYPNPFNAATKIQYALPVQSQVNLDIYNILGQHVINLVDDIQPAGRHSIIWDANGYSSGTYFVRLKTNDRTESMKMLLLK